MFLPIICMYFFCYFLLITSWCGVNFWMLWCFFAGLVLYIVFPLTLSPDMEMWYANWCRFYSKKLSKAYFMSFVFLSCWLKCNVGEENTQQRNYECKHCLLKDIKRLKLSIYHELIFMLLWVWFSVYTLSVVVLVSMFWILHKVLGLV